MAELRIGYFLEDLAQEKFILALVQRVAAEAEGLTTELRHEVRNATGGAGQALPQFGQFLDRRKRGGEKHFDVLVVAIDGNCVGPTQRAKEIKRMAEQKGYLGRLVCAVPNPHIEKWYLADPAGFQAQFQSPRLPAVPRQKCERDRYKRALAQALRDADLEAPLGGAEFGEEVVAGIDLYRAAKKDRALGQFLSELRQVLKAHVQTPHRS